jgi:hypothetical protein
MAAEVNEVQRFDLPGNSKHGFPVAVYNAYVPSKKSQITRAYNLGNMAVVDDARAAAWATAGVPEPAIGPVPPVAPAPAEIVAVAEAKRDAPHEAAREIDSVLHDNEGKDEFFDVLPGPSNHHPVLRTYIEIEKAQGTPKPIIMEQVLAISRVFSSEPPVVAPVVAPAAAPAAAIAEVEVPLYNCTSAEKLLPESMHDAAKRYFSKTNARWIRTTAQPTIRTTQPGAPKSLDPKALHPIYLAATLVESYLRVDGQSYQSGVGAFHTNTLTRLRNPGYHGNGTTNIIQIRHQAKLVDLYPTVYALYAELAIHLQCYAYANTNQDELAIRLATRGHVPGIITGLGEAVASWCKTPAAAPSSHGVGGTTKTQRRRNSQQNKKRKKEQEEKAAAAKKAASSSSSSTE